MPAAERRGQFSCLIFMESFVSFVYLLLRIAAVGALSTSCIASASSAPNYRALLIGVSSYPNLPERLQLQGPQNDVTRMRELLKTRGVPAQNIRVLADGVQGAELPTRAAILGALEQMAQTAKPNDYIVILVGGHGSQQPVPEGHPQAAAEPDGLFEIFLPRDVQGWSNKLKGADGEVQNAILDAEFRAVIDRMSAAGAFVWAIFDTCHSATMVRSAGNPQVRLRQVTPEELNVPRGAIDKAVTRASARPKAVPAGVGASGTPGQAVYFYASQTSEPTPEANLPYGEPGQVRHGLFSFSVIQTLEAASGPMSYEQLGQQVLTRYAGVTGMRTATPLFTGTALKAGVLAQDSVPYRQWQLKTGQKPLTVPAGSLSEVYEGSVLAVLPDALSKTEQALGYARVSKASATEAEIEPIAYDGKPAVDIARLAGGRMARMVQPGMQFALNVGIDLSACAKPCAFEAPLANLQKAPHGGVAGAQVKWHARGGGADVVLKAEGRRLWLMSAGAEQVALPKAADKRFVYLDAGSNATPSGIQDEIARFLQQVSKSTNLLRIATSVASNPATAALKVSVTRITSEGERPLGDNVLRPGDKIRVTLTNTSRKPMDVTAFYLDSKYGVGVIFPEGGELNRLDFQASTAVDMLIDDKTLGLERLAVIGVEAETLGQRSDLTFLARDKLESTVVTRGRGGDFFSDAGFATHVTRGGGRIPAPTTTGMQVLTFNVKQK
jgi:hypothetical protein